MRTQGMALGLANWPYRRQTLHCGGMHPVPESTRIVSWVWLAVGAVSIAPVNAC